MPDFSDASKVAQTIRAGDDVAFKRGENRTLINMAANNEPLMDEAEAKKIGMKIFNRWGEFMNALADAARQYITNFTSQDTYFTISLPKAPEEKRSDWGDFITEFINDRMKEGDRSMDFFMVHYSKWKAVVAHGIGPQMWEDKYSWLPRYVAIEDLRIATDTELSFRNLTWFAIRIAYTPGELSAKAFSKTKTKFKWDTKAVSAVLKSVKECNTTMAENNYDWDTMPEKFEELRKQNAGYWSGDAMPTIPLWHFYHKSDNGGWELKVVPDKVASTAIAETSDKFICQSEGSIASSWREIVHVQYGDLNNKAPLMYHSVRSLGFALFEPCFWRDMTFCRFLQHVHDGFNILLRMSDPVDRARAQIQTFQNMGVVKPGVTIIPNTERHQIQHDLVESALAQTKQLQQQASTSYTQDIDTGTAKEQTAFEVGVKVQQFSALLSGLMLLALKFEKPGAKEICRRFCLENTDDEDCKDFQEACEKEGIPKEWLNVKKWKIEITLPLGKGNPTMAMVEAENALKLRPLANPSAQRQMEHDAAVQMVGNTRAKAWFPVKTKAVSEASAAASAAFPVLMMGLPPQIPEGLNVIQQIQTLIGLTSGYIHKIESTTKLPTPDELIGLKTCAWFIGQLVQSMSGDMGNQPLFKKFSEDLSQLNNDIKKLEVQLQKQMQKAAQQNGNGEHAKEIAELKLKLAESQLDAQIKQKEFQRDSMESQARFQQEQKREDIELAADIRRKDVSTQADIQLKEKQAEAAPKKTEASS